MGLFPYSMVYIVNNFTLYYIPTLICISINSYFSFRVFSKSFD